MCLQGMISKCKAAAVPEPEFVIHETEFKVIFRFVTSIGARVVEIATSATRNLTNRQHKILGILSQGKDMKLKEILEQLPDKPAERTLRDDLAFLRGNGFIESKGTTKTMLWTIKK